MGRLCTNPRVHRLLSALAVLAIAAGVGACGGSHGSHTVSSSLSAGVAAPSTATSTGPSAAGSPSADSSGTCRPWLALGRIRITPGPAPDLAALRADLLGAPTVALHINGTLCAGEGSYLQTVRVSGLAQWRPLVRITARVAIAGTGTSQVRIIGSRGYVRVPGSSRWGTADVTQSNSRLAQLFGEVQQFDPRRPSELSVPDSAYRPLGTARVSGRQAYAYRATLTVTQLARVVAREGLSPVGVIALQRARITRIVARTYISGGRVAQISTIALYRRSRLLVAALQTAQQHPAAVQVSPPPAAQIVR